MASIFKQCYTAIDPNTGKRVKKKSKHWYIGYTDSGGIRRRVKAYTDKDSTQQMAARLEKEPLQKNLWASGGCGKSPRL